MRSSHAGLRHRYRSTARYLGATSPAARVPAPGRRPQPIGPPLGVVTDAWPPKPVGIGAEAAIIGSGQGLALGCCRAHRLAVVGVPAAGARHHALEQRPRTLLALSCLPLLGAPRLRDRRTAGRRHARRHGHPPPCLGRHLIVGLRTPGLPLTPPLGAQARTPGAYPCLPQPGPPPRGRMLEHAPPRAPIPHGLARPRLYPRPPPPS